MQNIQWKSKRNRNADRGEQKLTVQKSWAVQFLSSIQIGGWNSKTNESNRGYPKREEESGRIKWIINRR